MVPKILALLIVVVVCAVLNNVIGTKGITAIYLIPVPDNIFNNAIAPGSTFTGWRRMYQVNLKADEILDFYQSALTRGGWNIETEKTWVGDCLKAEKYIFLTVFIEIINQVSSDPSNTNTTSTVFINVPPARSECQDRYWK